MTLDTTTINQRMDRFDGHAQVWLFGYGSLIYKADFPFIERRRATLDGWSRRFWQGSHDHRGTASAPGRVVTLIADAGARCVGVAYLVTPASFAQLDVREKNGYLRFAAPVRFAEGDSADALVYIAAENNAAWLGPASERELAAHIAGAEGPSGRNRDYLILLAAALRELGAEDDHVFTIERYLNELDGRGINALHADVGGPREQI